MHQRIAGCVAGIVMVLGWEALSATPHPAPAREHVVVVSDDPLVQLSHGVLGVSDAPEADDQAWDVEAALFIQADEEDAGIATCEVVATAACPRGAGAAQPQQQDGGVESAPSASVVCPRPRKG